MTCISHHFACTCREEMFANLAQAAKDVETVVKVVADGIAWPERERLRACLAQYDGRDVE